MWTVMNVVVGAGEVSYSIHRVDDGVEEVLLRASHEVTRTHGPFSPTEVLVVAWRRLRQRAHNGRALVS